MAIILDGTTGITTPAEAVAGNLSYTGTLTGSTGVVNLGSGQVYKDASGNVGVGTLSPTQQVHVKGTDNKILIESTDYAALQLQSGSVGTFNIQSINDGSGALRFFDVTAAAERARIDSSGNLMVGQTSTGARFAITQPIADWCINMNTTSSGAQYFSVFRYNGSLIGQITGNNTNTSYTTSSDYRLKNTIAPMTGALAKVALLKPCTYKWNVDGSDGQGFIAHELQEVVEGCVTGEKDAVETYTDEDGNEATRPVYQGIDTSFLIATLSAAIQELHALVKTQDSTITALTTRITALEGAAA